MKMWKFLTWGRRWPWLVHLALWYPPASWWTSFHVHRSLGFPAPFVSWGQEAPFSPHNKHSQEQVCQANTSTHSPYISKELPADRKLEKRLEIIVGPLTEFIKIDWFNYDQEMSVWSTGLNTHPFSYSHILLCSCPRRLRLRHLQPHMCYCSLTFVGAQVWRPYALKYHVCKWSLN